MLHHHSAIFYSLIIIESEFSLHISSYSIQSREKRFFIDTNHVKLS